MHYSAFVLIPGEGDVDDLVAEAMAPYGEDREVEQTTDGDETYWHNPVGFWDRYQIDGDIEEALVILPMLDEEKMPDSFIVHGSESVAHKQRYITELDCFRNDFTPDRMLALIRQTIAARRAAGYEKDRLVVVDYHS